MNRILIIEDSAEAALIAARMCEQAGFHPREVKLVSTLEEGMRLAEEGEAPDLILLDLRLDGEPPVTEDECIALGIPQLSKRAPVVVLTGSVSADVVVRCHAAGAHSCLLKQNVMMEKCGIAMLRQAIGDSILNWRREHGPSHG